MLLFRQIAALFLAILFVENGICKLQFPEPRIKLRTGPVDVNEVSHRFVTSHNLCLKLLFWPVHLGKVWILLTMYLIMTNGSNVQTPF